MTIEEILTAFHADDLTREEAVAAIDAYTAELLLSEADRLRAGYAAAALEGLLSTGVRKPSIEEFARECFDYADAMVAGMEGTLPEPEPAPLPWGGQTELEVLANQERAGTQEPLRAPEKTKADQAKENYGPLSSGIGA